MQESILSFDQKQDLKKFFSGEITYISENDIEEYSKLIIENKNLTEYYNEPISELLTYIEILIAKYNPKNDIKWIEPEKVTVGEFIHQQVINKNYSFNRNDKFDIEIINENFLKLVKEYFRELINITPDIYNNFTIELNNHSGNQFLLEKQPGFIAINYDFNTHINITPSEDEYLSNIRLLFKDTHPDLMQLTYDLKDYINAIDPIIMIYLYYFGKLPLYVKYKLRMKDDKKVDIVRFGDFLGLEIHQINQIFQPKVDTNNRYTVSKIGGILTVLNKYKHLRRENSKKY